MAVPWYCTCILTKYPSVSWWITIYRFSNAFALFYDEDLWPSLHNTAPGCRQPSWQRWQASLPLAVYVHVGLRSERQTETETKTETKTETETETGMQLERVLVRRAHLGVSGDNGLWERHCLFLTADHACDLLVFCELQLGNALKTLLEVRLNSQRVFRLWQNLQQFIIGQEKEPTYMYKVYTMHTCIYCMIYTL